VQLRFPPARRLVFLRSWNDWMHGSALLPDRRYRTQRLDAVRRAREERRPAPPPREALALSPVRVAGLASVILPAYNHAAYIEEAVRSVLAQTWPDVELIVVDDGSTDGTLERARELAAQYPQRMRVIAQANQGAHVAINRGLAEARGDYLAILNSDD